MINFKVITSVKDPLYTEALTLYDAKLDISLTEDSSIFKRSLENNKTENDYVFLVGTLDGKVVSLATAHYEATTNAAFLIYLIARDGEDHDDILTATLEQVENELNTLSHKVHDRDINFMMLEVPKSPEDSTTGMTEIIQHRRQFLYEHDFIQQTEIDYIHPNYTKEDTTQAVDLFIKSNIELTKDIYGTSIKSNYILKYVFANGISRDIIYPLLEKMGLRKVI